MNGPFFGAPNCARIRILPYHDERGRPRCLVEWQDYHGTWHRLQQSWPGTVPPIPEMFRLISESK